MKKCNSILCSNFFSGSASTCRFFTKTCQTRYCRENTHSKNLYASQRQNNHTFRSLINRSLQLLITYFLLCSTLCQRNSYSRLGYSNVFTSWHWRHIVIPVKMKFTTQHKVINLLMRIRTPFSNACWSCLLIIKSNGLHMFTYNQKPNLKYQTWRKLN